jgi:hypothetical protein
MPSLSRAPRSQLVAVLAGIIVGSASLGACGAGSSGATTTGTPHAVTTASPSAKPDVGRLKGIQVHWNDRMKKQGSPFDLAASPDESYFSLDDVKRMKQAGANYIELNGLPLPDLMRERNVPNESYFTNWVDVWVDWCTQTKMYCTLNIPSPDDRWDWAYYQTIPSWLWAGISDPPSPAKKAACDATIVDFFDLDVAKQDANRAAFINLWKYIADRYKDNPYVMYGILNEPFAGVDVKDAALHLSHSYSTFMEQVVDGIRSTGSKQNVIIDRPFLWSSRDGAQIVDAVDREGIIWEAHEYVNVAVTPTFPYFMGQMDEIVRQFVTEFKKPLMIGEYGIDPLTDIRTTYASNWREILASEVAYLDSKPLVGRQYVNWDEMYGEIMSDSGSSDLTAEESAWIIKTVLS